MSLTPADLKKVDVQMIRDVAAALEKQAASLSDIKNSFPNLPHVGNWTGVAATTADTELGVFGKLIGTHSEGRQAAAAKMREAADEFEAAKAKLSKIENEAQGKFSIDYATGAVKPLSDKPEAAQQAAELTGAIKRAVADGDAADATLTHAVNLADGDEKPSSLPMSMTGILGELDRIKSPRENQEFAFREVFKRAPTTPADWQTAAMLDAHNYDPKYKGVMSEVTAAKIDPQPGKGVVQVNAFIPGQRVWNFGHDKGDNRGFNPNALPEQARGNLLIDYENGLVVARDNPSVSVESGNVAVHKPDVSVVQGPGGAVNVKWDMADGFLPGGADMGKLSMHSVAGEMVVKPGDNGGYQIGGHMSDFPAYEVYGNGQAIYQYMPSYGYDEQGPLVQLMGDHEFGNPALLDQFHVDGFKIFPPDLTSIRVDSVQLGPIDNVPTAPMR
ncbi:hypothetical protein [Mycobacteroides abscessus]|uniref:hypothetical protein n=1 Tax=Mycobacteroides abscessus TaxID=36809 RepID=UPI000927A47A|nr:hypothetical protein [Mycobacteroides abscessus]SIH59244.1 Alpha/beta hydrolase of uncharacterised function (DUF1023) [Mycobacteroides abscessus subsp. abscessus]SIN10532.1 Alpha/beta hydrolase of uncharacterised function (DUF1023) [Mycobacteroides abscessus subsp. abscessus]SIN11862.1 Alpha/beta hydrolase of uncharacterised function (DUF1023) [Mycobacteroides abscessus subsp. abscessus]SIN52681.1 Alpha/beta hydrolase of uncharacterised function (DUF1023) [Mycobacteroides abscessus subsp. ab